MALLGPGDAYVRGLKQEGREVPGERAAPALGGRVVLLRGGQAVRGFLLVQEALDEARDGDVVELRTDATLAGGAVPKGRGTVTVRAAPGYRPVLQTGLRVMPDSALVAEGLTFADKAPLLTDWAADLPPEQRGRVVRLAYCALELGQEPEWKYSTYCLFQGGKDAPGEVVRCVITRPVAVRIDRDTSVRFRECILNGLSFLPPDKQAGSCSVDMEACAAGQALVFWDQTLFGDRSTDVESRWQARRCLFEGGQAFLAFQKAPSWSGERNVYNFWGALRQATGLWSLAQWQAVTRSPETGSVQGEPLIADPARWRLPAGVVPEGVGPDIARFAAR